VGERDVVVRQVEDDVGGSCELGTWSGSAGLA
jgi:hypothetical protein